MQGNGKFFRLAASAGFLMSSASAILISRKIDFDVLLCCITISTAVLLLPHSRRSAVYAAVMDVISILLSVVFSFVHDISLFPFSAYAVAIAPVVLSRYRESIEVSLDEKRFVTSISGWEAARSSSRMMYSALFAVVSAMLFVFGGLGHIFSIISFSMMALLAVFVFILGAGGYHSRKQVRPVSARTVKSIARASAGDSREVLPMYRGMFNRMTDYMEKDRPFTDSDFSLEQMALALGSNRGYVSRMINTCTGLNFCQYVNEYRVRYAVELLEENKGDMNAMDIAYSSGFSNRPSFNMAFKLFMNMTPSEWMRAQEAAGKRINRKRRAHGRRSKKTVPEQSAQRAFS